LRKPEFRNGAFLQDISIFIATKGLLQRNHEHDLSTRDRPARAGADARIEESAATGKVRLAIRHYGRCDKRVFLLNVR
jgi:hypothetical protein